MSLDPLALLAARLGLALVLGAAALHKLREPARFAAALAGYQVLPVRPVRAVARALPLLEAGAALGLLLPALAPRAALLALGLIGAYSLAIGFNLARGRRDIDCGCSFGGARQPLSAGLLLRNALLALVACAAALPAAAREPLVLDRGLALLAAASLALLYHAADALLASRARLIETERA